MVTNNLAIIGHGGFAKEVEAWARNTYFCNYYVEDEYAGRGALPLSKFDPTKSKAIIAIGDPSTRRRIADSMPKETNFATLIHPSAQIIDPSTILIMKGCIICAGVVITTDVIVSEHAHINLNCTVGHGARIGRYNTLSPGVNISGDVTLGSYVYVGTNTAVKEKTSVVSNVTIGMGSTVIRDIKQSGTYFGLVK